MKTKSFHKEQKYVFSNFHIMCFNYFAEFLFLNQQLSCARFITKKFHRIFLYNKLNCVKNELHPTTYCLLLIICQCCLTHLLIHYFNKEKLFHACAELDCDLWKFMQWNICSSQNWFTWDSKYICDTNGQLCILCGIKRARTRRAIGTE